MTTQRFALPIEGMTCAGCVPRVEQVLRHQPGVIWATLNFAASEALIFYDPRAFDLTRLVEAIRGLGYEPCLDPSRMPSPNPRLWPRGLG